MLLEWLVNKFGRGSKWTWEDSKTIVDEVEREADIKVETVSYSDSELNRMTKAELENLGREYGVELDRRKKKAMLVEEIKSVVPCK
tara:strand:+ start:53329 stop:53586 length:258 start_codon:yes stop_codon:yes gene_type:complete